MVTVSFGRAGDAHATNLAVSNWPGPAVRKGYRQQTPGNPVGSLRAALWRCLLRVLSANSRSSDRHGDRPRLGPCRRSLIRKAVPWPTRNSDIEAMGEGRICLADALIVDRLLAPGQCLPES